MTMPIAPREVAASVSFDARDIMVVPEENGAAVRVLSVERLLAGWSLGPSLAVLRRL